jgi:hypothetical protein
MADTTSTQPTTATATPPPAPKIKTKGKTRKVPDWAEAPRKRLATLADQTLKAANNEAVAAQMDLVKTLLADAELVKSVVHEIAYDAIRLAVARANAEIIRDRAIPTNSKKIKRAAERCREWHRYNILAGRVRLSDALRSDVLAQADEHKRNAESNARKERFFRRIAKRLPNNKTPVGKVLTDEQIDKIYQEECGEAEE